MKRFLNPVTLSLSCIYSHYFIIFVSFLFRAYFQMLRHQSTFHMAKRLSSSYYDVVIVGGGLVGNAMACSLGMLPFFSSIFMLLDFLRLFL